MPFTPFLPNLLRAGMLTLLGLLGLSRTSHAASTDHGLDDALSAEAQAFAPPFIVTTGPAPTATQRNQVGTWGSVINWTPHIPVTAATLPDGRLLTFSSNQRTTFPVGAEFTYAAVWNPATGVFTEINNPRHDMFCGGTAMLPDGRLVINGGRNTTRLSSLFDWRTNQWSAIPNMNDPRWYNTSVALTDGSVFTVTGDGGTNTAERWTETTGWTRYTGINWATVVTQPGYVTRWHPLIVVAPDNRLFHGGPTDQMNWINPTGAGSLTFANANVPGAHFPKEGCFAMYDEGRILVAGGSANTTPNPLDSSTGTSTNLAFTIDIRGTGAPVVTQTASMKFVRQFCNSVILPNGEVMVIGGNSSGLKFNDTGSILSPEIWNPTTGLWREVTDMAVPRNYHSLALLLPDGRVWSGGGGLSGNAADHRDAQIYTPPMLYDAAGNLASRPTVTAAPASIGPGQVFEVQGSPGSTRFTFIKMSSQTHSMNTDLRFLELPFTSPTSGTYALTAHSNISVMTPGYWMLFAHNAQGVYSTARIIQVSTTNLPQLANPGAQSSATTISASLQLAATGNGALTYSATGLPAGLTVNPTTGLISGIVTAAPAVYVVTARVQNQLGLSATQQFNWMITPATLGSGTILREWWLNIGSGIAIQNLTSQPTYPNNPTGTNQPTSFEAPSNWADNYGTRMRGWLHAPVTGEYRFWVAGDDETHLLLSSDDNPANASIISRVSIWTDPQQWTKYPEQQSALITLQAGQKYYIEALMKEGGGGDNLAAAWQIPGSQGPVVIAGTYLSPWVPNRIPLLTNPGPRSDVTGGTVLLAVQASDADGHALTYSASGLPQGLSIAPTTGVISGTPSSTGVFNVTLSVTDNRSAPVTASFAWTIQPALTLQQPVSSPALVNTAVTFNATSNGGASPRYRWNFGDGTATTAYSSATTITHAFSSAGRYQVTLEATDNTGLIRSASFYQLIHAPLATQRPTVSSSLLLEDRSTANDRLWTVNPDTDSVTVLDAVTRAKLAEINVGTAPRQLALAADGRVWVTNVESASLSLINGSTLTVASTLSLPRGSRPFGIAMDPQGTAVFVVLEALGQVLKLHPVSGAQLGVVNVGANARHVSVSADGTRLYVSRFITPPLPGEDSASPTTANRGGEIVVVNASSMAVERTIVLAVSTEPDSPTSARGVPNYLGAVALSPDGLSAWIPSKQDNIQRGVFRDGSGLNHDQTLRAIASRLQLQTQSEDSAARVDFDNAGMPSAALFDPWGGYVFVALESSRAVAVIDAWNQEIIGRFDVGRAPQGLALSPDGRTLFVQNFMDRTVTVHDVSSYQTGGVATPTTLATLNAISSEKLSATVLRGKQLFYDARDSRLALQEYISCAACHNDGGQDGRVWDLTGFGEGLRNTITLRGHGNHGMLHWTGNFDEVHDFEGQIRQLAGGTGLLTDTQFNTGSRNQPLGDAKAGVSADLDALAAYVTSLTTESRSPFRNSDGSLTTAAVAGERVFRQQNCASCHSGTSFTNSALNTFRNIGTVKASSGKRLNGTLTGFDVPTLRGVWATAPYLHDGRAATLPAAISAHQGLTLSATELSDLVQYLQQIDEAPAAAPLPVTVQLSTSAVMPVSVAFQVSVTFSHPVTGFSLDDLTLSGGTASGLTGSGANYSFIFTPNANATLAVVANAAVDILALGNSASNLLTVPYQAPTLALVAQDIGDPALAGSTSHEVVSDVFTLTGGGSEIYFTRDEFHLASAVLSGDGEIRARVRSLNNTNPWAKAGVMIRESEDAGSRHAMMLITPPAAGNGFGMVWRTTVDGAATYQQSSALHPVPNNWVRLVRVGSVLTGYSSADGQSWLPVATATLPSLKEQVLIGLAVGSTDASLSATATFDNVSITGSLGASAPSVTLSANAAVETGAFQVRVQFTQSVTGLTPTDFNVNNGSVSALSGSGALYTAVIQPAEAGPVTVTLPAAAALNAANLASLVSNTLSVTYAPPLAVALAGQDIGSVQLAGSTSFNASTGTYTLKGAGGEIFFAADGFHYALTQITGDGEIRARVTSQTNTNPWAKAGVMFRENLTAGSRHAVMFTTPTNGFGTVWRPAANAASTYAGGSALNPAPNNWVRIVRNGNVLTTFSSANGSTWRTVSTITLTSLSSSLYVGLAVTATNASQLGTATFDEVQIVGSLNAVPPTVTLSSAAAIEAGPFTVQARFSQAVTGLAPSDFSVSNGAATQLSGSGTTFQVTIMPLTAGPVTLSLPAASAVNAGNVPSAASNVLNVTYAPPISLALTPQDIGAVQLAGSTTLNADTYTVKGAGDEIFFTADGFHFAHTQLVGDGEIRARVTSQTYTNDWAKAGVMFRETLSAGSRHAVHFTLPAASGNGTGIVWRTETNAASTFEYGPPLNPSPNNWVRLTRLGNVISAFASADGSSWNKVNEVSFTTLPATLYVGLAVTATSASQLATATFDNVQVIGTQAGQTVAGSTGGGTTLGSVPTSATVNDTDMDGDDVHDLIEYALDHETSYDGGWWLSHELGGRIDAHVIHPAAVKGVSFSLETSTDLRIWQPLPLAATVTDLGGGYLRRTWSGLSHLSSQRVEQGLVRLRVTHQSQLSAATAPQAWQQHHLRPGAQTVGVSLVRPPLYAGYALNVTGPASLTLNQASPLLPAAGTSYYLEVRDGPHAGHRYDISSFKGSSVTLTLASPRNTLSTLPPEIAGERVVIRPHVTLGQVFASEDLTASVRQTSADQVLFHTGKSWDSFWLHQDSQGRRWVKSGDAKMSPRDSEVIPPGTGLMMKRLGSPVTLTQLGHVRLNPFRRKLQVGHNFLALPWPVAATPNQLGFNRDAGFTASTSLTTADQVQRWMGDDSTQASGYEVFWLREAGDHSLWVPQSGSVTTDVGDSLKLPAHRAFFLKLLQPMPAAEWQVP